MKDVSLCKACKWFEDISPYFFLKPKGDDKKDKGKYPLVCKLKKMPRATAINFLIENDDFIPPDACPYLEFLVKK